MMSRVFQGQGQHDTGSLCTLVQSQQEAVPDESSDAEDCSLFFLLNSSLPGLTLIRDILWCS